jgi:hypothetical protein
LNRIINVILLRFLNLTLLQHYQRHRVVRLFSTEWRQTCFWANWYYNYSKRSMDSHVDIHMTIFCVTTWYASGNISQLYFHICVFLSAIYSAKQNYSFICGLWPWLGPDYSVGITLQGTHTVAAWLLSPFLESSLWHPKGVVLRWPFQHSDIVLLQPSWDNLGFVTWSIILLKGEVLRNINDQATLH